MRKNLNIIQINGIRGIVLAIMAVCCLAVGFIGFPGWIMMHLWNLGASHFLMFPSIGIFQGILLWAIIIASYFTFRKNKMIICVKSPQGLDDEELKNIFADIRERAKEDVIKQAMYRAKEVEQNIKTEENNQVNCEAQSSNQNHDQL
ncbi:MAG: hypothetical protein MJ237_03070 [bacterium]|nr:hypothetical protein [bacterium]